VNDAVLDAGLGGGHLDFLDKINGHDCMGTGRALIHESCCNGPVVGALLNFFSDFFIIMNWVFVKSFDIDS
jgi:hypothetical protein